MKRFAAAAIALSFVGASVAMADGRHDQDHRRNWSADHSESDVRRDHGRDWQYRHDGREARFHNDQYRGPWGYREQGYREHDWRRGERLPVAYYAPPYVIPDYRSYRLREPPRGCHWVRVNNDVVLAAIASGVVLDIVYNAF